MSGNEPSENENLVPCYPFYDNEIEWVRLFRMAHYIETKEWMSIVDAMRAFRRVNNVKPPTDL